MAIHDRVVVLMVALQIGMDPDRDAQEPRHQCQGLLTVSPDARQLWPSSNMIIHLAPHGIDGAQEGREDIRAPEGITDLQAAARLCEEATEPVAADLRVSACPRLA